MKHSTTKLEQAPHVKARLQMIQHFEQVTHNVSRTCRFFGISRTQSYYWIDRYRKHGVNGPAGILSEPHRTWKHSCSGCARSASTASSV